MSQFFKNNENGLNALDVLSRLDSLVETMNKAVSLNKNENNLDGFQRLTQCRAAIVDTLKAPSAGSSPFEANSEALDNSTPRFGN